MRKIKKGNKIIELPSRNSKRPVKTDTMKTVNKPLINLYKLFEGLKYVEKTSVLMPKKLSPDKIKMIAIDSLSDENCRDEDDYCCGYLRNELSGVFEISKMEHKMDKTGTRLIVYTVPEHCKHLEWNKDYLLDVFKDAYTKVGHDIKDITIKSF